jgi:hypothetical protein
VIFLALGSSSLNGDMKMLTANMNAVYLLMKLTLVLVRLDHVASRIVNADHGIM